MGKFFDIPDIVDSINSKDARDTFQFYHAKEQGFDPHDAGSMATYFEEQETEWENRGVPAPGYGSSRCQAFDEYAHPTAYPGMRSILDE